MNLAPIASRPSCSSIQCITVYKLQLVTNATIAVIPKLASLWQEVASPRHLKQREGESTTISFVGQEHSMLAWGLMGEDVFWEIRSTFPVAMGNDNNFPFRFLQIAGGGSKSLIVPLCRLAFDVTLWEIGSYSILPLSEMKNKQVIEAAITTPNCLLTRPPNGPIAGTHVANWHTSVFHVCIWDVILDCCNTIQQNRLDLGDNTTITIVRTG